MGDYYDDRHKLRDHDFAVLDRFEFKYSPVGFKYFNVKPEIEGLNKLDKELAWCQMLPEAQKGNAFYAEKDNQYCEPGIFLPGHDVCDPIAGGGRKGMQIVSIPWHHLNRVLGTCKRCLGHARDTRKRRKNFIKKLTGN